MASLEQIPVGLLWDLFNEVTRKRDQKQLVVIPYFNIKKTFDKAPHNPINRQ